MVDTLIRPARPDEVWQILAWRNAPRVRQSMLTQHEISRAEHETWFQRKLVDPLFRQMLSEEGGIPVSVQAFFDIQSGHSAWWAFYFTDAVPDDMVAMLRIWKGVELAGLVYAFEVLGLQTLYCEVLRSNSGVTQWHQRFGFEPRDPAVSANADHFDLQVFSLSRTTYTQLRAGRNGQDMADIGIVRHAFDTSTSSQESRL